VQRELIVRASNGDHDAFAQLVGEVVDRLHRTARLILRSDEQAADAVQEALLSAWLHIRAVREPERFEGWLYRLVVNACYVEARRQKRRTMIAIRLAPIGRPDDPDAFEQAGDRDQLERAFARLSAEQRAVLVVHHYLGMTESEAAIALDIPIGTFKSRLSRATQALRAAIDADQRVHALGGSLT